MRFNMAFSKKNVISFDAAPVTNRNYVAMLMAKGEEVPPHVLMESYSNPDGANPYGTLRKVRAKFPQAFVQYA